MKSQFAAIIQSIGPKFTILEQVHCPDNSYLRRVRMSSKRFTDNSVGDVISFTATHPKQGYFHLNSIRNIALLPEQ